MNWNYCKRFSLSVLVQMWSVVIMSFFLIHLTSLDLGKVYSLGRAKFS